MFDNFGAYGNTVGFINSIETDKEIQVFLSKYKHWYVKERHLSKNEAERHIRDDIKYFLTKFDIKAPLYEKLKNIFHLQIS